MHPVIFDFGKWDIRSYDIVLCLSIITGMILIWGEARSERYPAGRFVICLLGTLICAILGARINGWFFWFRGNPDMLSLNLFSTKSGMTAFGGLAGAFGFSALYAYLNRWNVLRLLDIIAPVFALAEGIQRTGCFLNGCCYGHDNKQFSGVLSARHTRALGLPVSNSGHHRSILYDSLFLVKTAKKEQIV